MAAGLCALFPAGAARAEVVTVELSTFFASGSAGSMTLTGRFTGDLVGNRITDITDIALFRDGHAFRGNGSLFALQYDAVSDKWSPGGYLSLDGSANNIMFIDSNYALGDARFFNYFSSITGLGNAAFAPSFYGYRTPNTSQLEMWVHSAAPEPAAWALLILGFGAIGAALRRRPGLFPRLKAPSA